MGWKISSVIINNDIDWDNNIVLEKLGFKNLDKIEDQPFDVAMCPGEDEIYIGRYKNNIIISESNLPLNFFSSNFSDIEEKFIEIFPNSEICAVSLQSTINHFGFAVIKDGKKIRVKAGDWDNGTIIDSGNPLEQEVELLSQSRVDDKGQRLYYLHNQTDEPYREDQVGENFVFEIFKRYTGEALNADEDLLDTIFTGYRISSKRKKPFDVFFSGEWQGRYSYGDGYAEKVKGNGDGFILEMNLANGGIMTGVCYDGNKRSEKKASINGFIMDLFIGFVKTYPGTNVIDENGVTTNNISTKSYSVIYSGLYDSFTDSFKGVWRIENKKLWGEWSMSRKEIKS